MPEIAATYLCEIAGFFSSNASRPLSTPAATSSREGHDVVINCRGGADHAQARELRRGTCRANALQGDMRIAKDVDRLIGTTIDHFGRLDCVVDNVGIGEKIALDAWTKLRSPERSTPT
jgi:NAD(P)-dependent dehydrogenase (short-subunit alcohol dehydrogenase family)